MTSHFFDIGANDGNTFEHYLLKHPEFDGWMVWCFEPSPRSWPGLCATAERLAGRYRITLCPFGLAAVAGTPVLYQQACTLGDSFCANLLGNAGQKVPRLGVLYELRAATVTLSSFILANTGPVDEIVLKLDCEGSEFGILRELLACPEALGRCSRILAEWHLLDRFDSTSECDALKATYAATGHPIEGWQF